jgi:hypothetical protein
LAATRANQRETIRRQAPRWQIRLNRLLNYRDVRIGVPLTAVKAAIFDAVERAGANGITAAQANDAVFDGRTSLANVRMHVLQINEKLARAGVRIRSDAPLRGRYRLVRISLYGDCPGS